MGSLPTNSPKITRCGRRTGGACPNPFPNKADAAGQVARLIHASGFSNEPGTTTGNLSACLVMKAVRSRAVTAAMAKL
jgi:hypothetical protein